MFPPGPSNDPFLPLYSSRGHQDISAFVNSHYRFAKDSVLDPPSWSLQYRFPVQEVGVGKSHTTVEHESFVLWGFDERTKKNLEFVMDRVPSDSHSSRFSSFSQFPNSDQVLASIQKATPQSAGAITPKAATETETVPLLPLTSESPSTSSTSFTSQSNISQLSLTDRVTSSLAKAFAAARTASQSISPQNLAQDSIRGYPPGSLKSSDCILTFKPVGLTVFDVVLIGKLVHDYAPIYGLFDNQCYMFARVIFDVIVQLFSVHPSAQKHPSTSIRSSKPVPHPSEEVNLPKNANTIVVPMPDQAGRWAGLLILDPIVKKTIVTIIGDRFNVERPLYAV